MNLKNRFYEINKNRFYNKGFDYNRDYALYESEILLSFNIMLEDIKNKNIFEIPKNSLVKFGIILKDEVEEDLKLSSMTCMYGENEYNVATLRYIGKKK